MQVSIFKAGPPQATITEISSSPISFNEVVTSQVQAAKVSISQNDILKEHSMPFGMPKINAAKISSVQAIGFILEILDRIGTFNDKKPNVNMGEIPSSFGVQSQKLVEGHFFSAQDGLPQLVSTSTL